MTMMISPAADAIDRAYYAEWEAAYKVLLNNLIQSEPRADEFFRNHIRCARQARSYALQYLKDLANESDPL